LFACARERTDLFHSIQLDNEQQTLSVLASATEPVSDEAFTQLSILKPGGATPGEEDDLDEVNGNVIIAIAGQLATKLGDSFDSDEFTESLASSIAGARDGLDEEIAGARDSLSDTFSGEEYEERLREETIRLTERWEEKVANEIEIERMEEWAAAAGGWSR
jgi:hypothetical protein